MKDFKEIRSEWYKRLKDSGFVDIEDEDGNLKTFNIPRLSVQAQDYAYEKFRWVQNEHYYALCTDFMNQDVFQAFVYQRPQISLIWQAYCEGKTKEQIEKAFNMPSRYVRTTIENVRRIMMGKRHVDTRKYLITKTNRFIEYFDGHPENFIIWVHHYFAMDRTSDHQMRKLRKVTGFPMEKILSILKLIKGFKC